MKTTITALLLLPLFVLPALAQLSVGDTAPTPDHTATMNADNIMTATGTMRFLGGGGNVGSVDVASDGSATFYLYKINGEDDITAVYGPFYTRAWMPARSPLTGIGRADMLHVTAISADELVVNPRSN